MNSNQPVRPMPATVIGNDPRFQPSQPETKKAYETTTEAVSPYMHDRLLVSLLDRVDSDTDRCQKSEGESMLCRLD